MNRIEKLRDAIQPGKQGIEIGPWHNPIAPKKDGFATLVVDVYDRDTLRAMATRRGVSEAKVDRIETVDFIGDASNLKKLVREGGFSGNVDWIISSHNFEHLPNPLLFLQDCQAILSNGGSLTMALPDKRFCFDRFQPPTTTSGVLAAAYQAPRKDAQAWAKFSQQSRRVDLVRPDGSAALSWSDEENDPKYLVAKDNVLEQFAELQQHMQDGTNPDFSGHRWHYTPAVFELIMLDLRALGLLNLVVEKFWDTQGYEFIVQLHAKAPESIEGIDYKAQRTLLLRQAEDETATVSSAYLELRRELEKRQPLVTYDTP